MNLLEVVRGVRRHLEESGRVSYRMLRRQFDLADDDLAFGSNLRGCWIDSGVDLGPCELIAELVSSHESLPFFKVTLSRHSISSGVSS